MRCLRCHGIMVRESFYGWGEKFSGFRCLNCGEILDLEILQNRRESQEVAKETRERRAEPFSPRRL